MKALTYKIAKYPPKLNRKEVDAEVARAFGVWGEYTDLTFRPAKGQVHIEVRFETGEHGDGDPFDGPGGTLAHAYFPVSKHLNSKQQRLCNFVTFRFMAEMPISTHPNAGASTPTGEPTCSKLQLTSSATPWV